MERLTGRNDFGDTYYKACFEKECNKENCRTCEENIKFCDALATYENLGVTPEQIREMDRLYLEKCEEVNRLKEQMNSTVEAEVEKDV